MKNILYILIPLLLLTVSCERHNVYFPVECIVSLDEGNTYVAGEAVTFNFKNEADNILFYSGEDYHQYKYKDRYIISEEDVTSMILTLNIQHRFGSSDPALEIWYTNSFDGLTLEDGEAEAEMMKEMYAGGMQGWYQFPYDDLGTEQDVTYTYTCDVGSCISNLCIGFYWNPGTGEKDKIDTYWVNGYLDVDIAGSGTTTYSLGSLLGQVVSLYEIDGTYYYYNHGNGSIRLDTSNDITFAGGYSSTEFNHPCEGWLFTYPRAFNRVDPDAGEVVKDIQNYAGSFSYVYEEPGTYTATFVSTNANYLGGSRIVQDITVTIVDDLTDY